MLRQVVLKVFEEQKTSSQILGTAKLRYSGPLPQDHHSYRDHPLREGIDCLDWDGELRCVEDDTVAGFVTHRLAVRVRIGLHCRYDFLFNDVAGLYRTIPGSSGANEVSASCDKIQSSDSSGDRYVVRSSHDLVAVYVTDNIYSEHGSVLCILYPARHAILVGDIMEIIAGLINRFTVIHLLVINNSTVWGLL